LPVPSSDSAPSDTSSLPAQCADLLIRLISPPIAEISRDVLLQRLWDLFSGALAPQCPDEIAPSTPSALVPSIFMQLRPIILLQIHPVRDPSHSTILHQSVFGSGPPPGTSAEPLSLPPRDLPALARDFDSLDPGFSSLSSFFVGLMFRELRAMRLLSSSWKDGCSIPMHIQRILLRLSSEDCMPLLLHARPIAVLDPLAVVIERLIFRSTLPRDDNRNAEGDVCAFRALLHLFHDISIFLLSLLKK
jgi:hypothetical protein